jgi:hypothetical protein
MSKNLAKIPEDPELSGSAFNATFSQPHHMDVEKDIIGESPEPVKTTNLEKKMKQAYFARRPSNINHSTNKGSDGFPGSSSDESTQEIEGTQPLYVTSVDFDETNIN